MTPAEMIEKLREKHYLFDGLYAHFDGYQIILEAERMGGGIHWVALEPSTLDALDQYREWLRLQLQEIRQAKEEG